MKRTLAVMAALALSLSASNVSALSLTLENKSAWEIHELYFSPADEKNWGPDQLEDEIIERDSSFELTKIAKGDYDVKIVDEDGDVCEVRDVDFRSTEHFVITDKILVGCQVATAVEHAEEEE